MQSSMASIWGSAPPILVLCKKPLSLRSLTLILPSSSIQTTISSNCVALRASGAEGSPDPAVLRRPLASTPSLEIGEPPSVSGEDGASVDDGSPGDGRDKSRRKKKTEDEFVDWEDQILEDTVPLVGFVRMILHSGKYEDGNRLSTEHEKTIMKRLLPYHPEFEEKIGCGVDFIKIGFHPEFDNSRCMFIVRKDGTVVDFSYWKCIKGLIRKKYPLYADSFILRHFRRRRHSE